MFTLHVRNLYESFPNPAFKRRCCNFLNWYLWTLRGSATTGWHNESGGAYYLPPVSCFLPRHLAEKTVECDVNSPWTHSLITSCVFIMVHTNTNWIVKLGECIALTARALCEWLIAVGLIFCLSHSMDAAFKLIRCMPEIWAILWFSTPCTRRGGVLLWTIYYYNFPGRGVMSGFGSVLIYNEIASWLDRSNF